MNFQTIATLAAAAVAATAISVNAAACNTTAIAGLLGSDDVATCAEAASYTFTSLTTPTAEQITAMCGNEACLSALASLQELNLGDCTVANFAIMSGLVNPIVSTCNDTSSSGTTATASSSSGAAETTVGESSTTGSDNTVETTAPAASSGSESTEAPPAASAASAASASSVGSSGSNSGVALTATSAIVGSVMLAAAMMA